MKAVKPMNEEMYSVHLHPRYDIVMKPPANGASNGPMNTVAEKQAIARPQVSLLYMSAKITAHQRSGKLEPSEVEKLAPCFVQIARAMENAPLIPECCVKVSRIRDIRIC
jgi:hypothetical protein